MVPTRLLPAFALFLFITVKRVSGTSATAMFNDSVQLSLTENCAESLAVELMTGDSTVTVATRVNGEWKPAEKYKDRIRHHSLSSVILTNVNYKDRGLYEFFCDGRFVSSTHLTVATTVPITAAKGDPVQLPCSFFAAKSVRWFENGTELQIGARFGERASESTDGPRTGNFALTLTEVRLEDRGDFLCRCDVAEDGKACGDPVAVKLRVNARKPDQSTNTTSPRTSEQEKGMRPSTTVSLTFNGLLAFLVIVLVFVIIRMKSCKSNLSPGRRGEEEHLRTELLTSVTDGNPAGSPANGGGPPSPNHNHF